MKRILTTFLTLLLILGLAGCGNTGQQHTDMPVDSTQVNPESNTPTLETKPGVFRQTTVAVGSFQPNAWGLYDMHGNVGE